MPSERSPVMVKAPASKSVSHRAVIAAALAEGESILDNVLASDDLERTMDCMAAMGADVLHEAGLVRVTGTAGKPRGGEDDAPVVLNVGESGTTCRLLTAVAAAGKGFFHLHGEGRMHDRPIKALSDALQQFSVRFAWLEKEGYPPFVISSDGHPGGETAVDLGQSSQYLSGLLLAAPTAEKETIIGIVGDKVVSWPYVALTLQAMRDFDVDVVVERKEGESWSPVADEKNLEITPGKLRFRVQPAAYTARRYTVEGDWSNASYFLGAGAVGPNPVEVAGLRLDSIQGDMAMLDILESMGATLERKGDSVLVSSPSALHGVKVDMNTCPDIVPTVAVVAAAAAKTPMTITGVAHLRIKECDRMAAVADEIARVGGIVETFDDGLTVHPLGDNRPKGTVFHRTYGDHRIAMSMALFNLLGMDVRPDDPDVTSKSFPDFWKRWAPVLKAARGASA